jgi:hypothetical protein
MSRTTKFNFPKDDYDLLEQEKNVYAQKLDVAESPATRTPVNVKAKNAAKRVLKTHTRKSVKTSLINNPLLTEDDLTLLGLPVHDTKPTPAPPITTHPELKVSSKEIQQHIITAHDAETKSAGKPAHAVGFEIWRKVGGGAPVDDPDWQLAGLALRSPHELSYSEAESGLRVYYRARWVNTRGVLGPWSRTVSAIIP